MAILGEVAEREESVFEWTVRDFFSIPARVDERYRSPSLSFGGAQWYLLMYPNGETKYKSEGLIDVYLYRESPGPPIRLNWRVALITSLNKTAEESSHFAHTFKNQYDNDICIRFVSRSRLQAKQSKLAPSGHLTFVCRIKHPPSTDAAGAVPAAKCAHCKVTVNEESLPSHERKCLDKPIQCPECSDVVALKHWYVHECQPAKSKGEKNASGSVTKSTSKILEDFKQLLQNQEYCDVVLRVKECEFQAHRNILTVRSPVFASTFRNDMKEKATGVIDIEDCDSSTFSTFLRCIYYDDVEGITKENAASLFTVADKYDVSDLREKCLEFMKENLSLDTFCDTLTVALRHSETELIRLATDFFVANADKIIVTVAWQTFVAENPAEGNELFIKYVSSVKH